MQSAIAATFVVLVVALVSNETVGEFERETQRTLEREFGQIVTLYNDTGLRNVSQDMIVRSSAPGPLMYVLTQPAGDVIVGDFSALPKGEISEQPRPTEFKAEIESATGVFKTVRVRGVVGRLAVGGPILMVARDMSTQDAAANRIIRILLLGLGAGLFFALGAGLLAGRQAALRAEELSRTTRDVMAGDLARRAHITGGNDEFNRLAVDLNAMLDRLQTLVASSRSAGDAIAHDLRSPLTRMKTRLEQRLNLPKDTDADRAALNKALDETDRLLDTFNAVMQIAQLEKRNTWDFKPVDVSAVAAEFVEFYEPVAEEKNVRLSLLAGASIKVAGDERVLGQAVSNLIENAIKFTPEGGAILVEVRQRTDGAIELLVEDDGPGIPVQDRARVVDRFVRLEDHRNSPGIGLGLSLVNTIATVHRGRLDLRDGRRSGSGPGLGAALVLPAWSAR